MPSHPFTIATSGRKILSKKIGSDEWYLIDFADASLVPTTAATHLSPEGHSPRIQHDGHGAEVDIWGVANFMHQLHSVVKDPQQVRQMANKWKEGLNLTAAKALSEIEVGPALHHCNVFTFWCSDQNTSSSRRLPPMELR